MLSKLLEIVPSSLTCIQLSCQTAWRLYSTQSIDTQMGFLDKFKKKNEPQSNDAPQKSDSSQSQTTGKRIKKYTSEGKPVYE